MPKKSEDLLELAQSLANKRSGFIDRMQKGPGLTTPQIREFLNALSSAAELAFGTDYAKRKICGDNDLHVDFWFPEEFTIVAALLARNPLIEYESGVIKALMAIDAGYDVKKLCLLSKPFARRSFGHPHVQAIMKWALDTHGLAIVVHELQPSGCLGRLPN